MLRSGESNLASISYDWDFGTLVLRLSANGSSFASLSDDSDFVKTGAGLSDGTGAVRFSDIGTVPVLMSGFADVAIAAVRGSDELDLPGVFCGSGFTGGMAASFFSFSRCFSTIARFQAGRLANCSSSLTCFSCSSVSFCFLRSISAFFHGGTDIFVFVESSHASKANG